MSSIECMRARAWIDGRAAGLGDAERLRLEDHLTGCARCAADADGLAALRTLVETALPPESESQRERALRRAFATQAFPPAGQAPASARVRLARPALGLAFAAAAAVGLAFVLDPHAPSPTPPAPRAVATAPTSVLAGSLLGEGQRAAPGDDVRADVELTSLGPSRVRVGPAELVLEDRSAFRWEPARGTVHLRAGSLRARVEPLQRGTFRVATERFVVVVVGTRFSVSIEGVDVEEGSVRVEAPDGRVLARSLGAGARWREHVEPVAVEAHHEVGERRGDPRWLADARRRLAAGDVGGAREAIERARPSRLARSDRAEAETLRAECAQVEGRLRDAQQRYLRVAERYRDLAAGDNALFAAAKVAAMRGDRARERRLLERYLAEHPRGRFRLEAKRRLGNPATPRGRE